MALFDFLKLSDDPNQNAALTQGLLSAAFGGLAARGTPLQAIGQAGLSGLGGYSGAIDRQEQARRSALIEKRQSLQDELVKNQLDEQKRQSALRALPAQFAIPGTKPETMDNRDVGLPGEAPIPSGGFDMPGYIQALMGQDPLQALQLQAATKKAEPQPVAYKPGEVVGTWQGGKFVPSLSVPDKADKGTSDMQEFRFAQDRGEIPAGMSFTQWMRENKKAGAASVSVSTGQKGYENESKLRNDFKSEPIYKDFQDMQAAYKQIKAGAAQKTPIGDVAAATKLMKLLDPGSVVRESELGIAMAAGGRMDRLQNYVQMQISGEKLTPTMRKDFVALADELYRASAQAYNAKRADYEKMGSRYGLDPSVLGDTAKVDKGVPSESAIDAELKRRGLSR